MKICSFLMTILMCFLSIFSTDLTRKCKVADPAGLSTYEEEEKALINSADFCVSPAGDDSADGSYEHPFATIEKAKEAVSALDKSGRSGITVAVKSGEYRIESLNFTSFDSGTAECPVTYTAYGDGEVILNGGITIDPADFTAVTDEEMLSRLSSGAKTEVRCYDLGKAGISPGDYGKIYAIGSYNTAEKYTGDWVGGQYCELFINDERMTLARYPDEGYASTGKVVSIGEGKEKSSTEVNENWASSVDPVSDVYEISDELCSRIASWKTFDDVWMFGYWKYDWADASTPIGSFDAEKKTLSPKFVSYYGAKDDAPFYFFNVFEELTMPGEWYIDRVNNVLYVYPDDDFDSSTVELSVSSGNILSSENLQYVTFDGFTIKNTRGDAVSLKGNNLTLKNCVIKNCGGNAVIAEGSNNLVSACDVSHTGKGGIYIIGGDEASLTPGNSKADNNLIHDWSEIYKTYQPAVTLEGVGNTCSHNEIYNSPHEAITFRGNNHVIEYNNIHDVCQLTDDGGAIYTGKSWNWYGSVIRYNCIYDIGSDEHSPSGIYMDDVMSGVSIYGNLLVNIPKYGILLGGGRDLDVRNNIIINATDCSIYYDERGREAYSGGWYSATIAENWARLRESPWQSEIWQEAYPQMKSFSDDENDIDSPDFIPNPANSVVSGNVTVSYNGKIGSIADSVYEFSTVEGNASFRMTKLSRLFVNPDSGDYTVKQGSAIFTKIPEFEEIPVNEIGRY